MKNYFLLLLVLLVLSSCDSNNELLTGATPDVKGSGNLFFVHVNSSNVFGSQYYDGSSFLEAQRSKFDTHSERF